MKFDGAAPARWCSRFMIWLSSTLRDQPCSAAAAAYQSRSGWALSLSSRTVTWPQGNLANRLLANCGSGPCAGHLAHVLEVAPGQPSHLRERRTQVDGEPVDYSRAPALGLLTLEDFVADLPVHRQQLGIDDRTPASVLRRLPT